MHKLISLMRENRRIILMAVLCIAIVIQLIFLLDKFILPWGWRVKQVWDEPRLTRSADLSLGGREKRAIRFINRVVPEDATIVLPPTGEPGRFSLERSMQYFFFPRTLVQCDSIEQETCQTALSNSDTYILATQDFPPAERIMERDFAASPYDEGWWFLGIFGPEFKSWSEPEKMTVLGYGMLFFQDASIVIAIGLLGALSLHKIRGKWTALEILSLCFPTGAGIITLSIFLISWANVRLTTLTLGLLYLFLFMVLLSSYRPSKSKFAKSIDWASLGIKARRSRFSNILLFFCFLWFGLTIALSVGLSYRLTDPVQIWSVKGYGISEAGSILGAKEWGVHGLAYPLNIPLQVSIFHLADGDALPGSKLIYPLYAVSLCLGIYTFLRRQRLDQEGALLAVLLVATVPIFFFHSVSGFANLPYTFYLVFGVMWILKGIQASSKSEQLLGSLLLGLAAWTRPEGIGFCIIALIIYILLERITRKGRLYPLALLLPLGILALPWFVFSVSGSYMQGSNLDQAVSVYSSEVIRGNFDFSGLWTLFSVFIKAMFVSSITDYSWGVFFPVILIILLVNARNVRPRVNMEGFVLAVQTAAIAFTTIGIFYVRSYSKGGYASFIGRSFPRAFLPTAIMMVCLGFSILTKQGDEELDSTGSQ